MGSRKQKGRPGRWKEPGRYGRGRGAEWRREKPRPKKEAAADRRLCGSDNAIARAATVRPEWRKGARVELRTSRAECFSRQRSCRPGNQRIEKRLREKRCRAP